MKLGDLDVIVSTSVRSFYDDLEAMIFGMKISTEWEETTIRTIFKQHTGGAMKRKDQPEWMTDSPSAPLKGKSRIVLIDSDWLCAGFEDEAFVRTLPCHGLQ